MWTLAGLTVTLGTIYESFSCYLLSARIFVGSLIFVSLRTTSRGFPQVCRCDRLECERSRCQSDSVLGELARSRLVPTLGNRKRKRPNGFYLTCAAPAVQGRAW